MHRLVIIQTLRMFNIPTCLITCALIYHVTGCTDITVCSYVAYIIQGTRLTTSVAVRCPSQFGTAIAHWTPPTQRLVFAPPAQRRHGRSDTHSTVGVCTTRDITCRYVGQRSRLSDGADWRIGHQRDCNREVVQSIRHCWGETVMYHDTGYGSP